MNYLKKRKVEIFLFCMSIIVFLIFLELTLRLIWYPPQDKGYPKGVHIPDDTLGYKLNPGFSGTFPMEKYQSKNISVNSRGLRDFEHTYEKNHSILRILVLGDSCTFGSGVNIEDTYVKKIEEKMVSLGNPVETINAGVSGYEFLQESRFYENEGKKYNPDIVLVGIVLNDIFTPNITQINKNMNEFGYADRPADNPMERLVKNICMSCVFIYSLVHNYNDKYFVEIYKKWGEPEAFEKYSEELKILKKEVEENNGKLVLVLFPYTQQFKNSQDFGVEPQKKIKSLAEKEGIEVIDLYYYLDIEDYQKNYLYGDNLHLNEDGNEVIAQAISGELLRRGIISQPT